MKLGFWIFMLTCDMLLPVMMIGFGRAFRKHPPKEINGIYGYRTAMSMKSKETWAFAHEYIGKLWHFCGLALLAVTVAVMLYVIGQDEQTVGTVGGNMCVIQVVLMIGSIVPTEWALRRTFDKQGNPKPGKGK